MKLKILGTQSPYSTHGHHCPGFFITDGDNKIMLDCGSGSHSMLNIPHDLKNLHVILTHLHEDHYNDVVILQYAAFTNQRLNRIEKPIDIWLPDSPSVKYQKIINEKDSFATYHIISKEQTISIGNMTISFIQTDHPIETYAVKITDGSKTIVYTSDTSFSSKEKIADFAKGADLLICESSLLKSYGFPEISSHLTAEQAGIIAKEAGVKTLVLTHFWPDEPPCNYVDEAKTIFDNVVAAVEGEIIEVV